MICNKSDLKSELDAKGMNLERLTRYRHHGRSFCTTGLSDFGVWGRRGHILRRGLQDPGAGRFFRRYLIILPPVISFHTVFLMQSAQQSDEQCRQVERPVFRDIVLDEFHSVRQLVAHRVFRYAERFGDFFAAVAFEARHLEDLAAARRQLLDRFGDERFDFLRVELVVDVGEVLVLRRVIGRDFLEASCVARFFSEVAARFVGRHFVEVTARVFDFCEAFFVEPQFQEYVLDDFSRVCLDFDLVEEEWVEDRCVFVEDRFEGGFVGVCDLCEEEAVGFCACFCGSRKLFCRVS